ncbi:MAG: AraC family transcriptional regulator [Bacteroidota bacterium]
MKSYSLPEFFNGGKQGDVYIHHYRSDQEHTKNKIVLSKNLVCILLNGTKEVFGSHESIKIGNSEMLLVSAGHVLMWESIAQGKKLESLLIFFSNEILRSLFAKRQLNTDKHAKRAVVSMKKDEYVKSFERSLQLLDITSLRTIQQLKVEELLLYLELNDKTGSFHSFARNSLATSGNNRFREVVNANMSKGLTLDELAFLCNMSLSTFKRHFEKTFHCSPKKYFTAQRMERAKELLFSKRPSEVYLDLRYHNLSSFSTEFKKHFGVSPREFMRTN